MTGQQSTATGLGAISVVVKQPPPRPCAPAVPPRPALPAGVVPQQQQQVKVEWTPSEPKPQQGAEQPQQQEGQPVQQDQEAQQPATGTTEQQRQPAVTPAAEPLQTEVPAASPTGQGPRQQSEQVRRQQPPRTADLPKPQGHPQALGPDAGSDSETAPPVKRARGCRAGVRLRSGFWDKRPR